jgi:hypothetical protein
VTEELWQALRASDKVQALGAHATGINAQLSACDTFPALMLAPYPTADAAPAAVIDKERAKLGELAAKRAQLDQALRALSA